MNLRSNVKEVSVSDFENIINLKSGQTYSPSIVQSAITDLEEKLQAVGFEFIRVKPEVERNISSLTLDFDLVFEKGDRVFVERIDISETGDPFIAEGDPTTLR